jgi:hypothetical protein
MPEAIKIPPVETKAPNGSAPNREFLLMEGGPLFHLQRRVRLIKEKSPVTIRRAVIFALLAWLPLLILSLIQGTELGHVVPVPFLRDFSAYARFLLAIPLFIAAETILGPRIAESAAHFVTSGLVMEKDYKRFGHAIDLGLKNRDSVLAEIVIAIVAFMIPITAFRTSALHVSTWQFTRTDTGVTPTAAGWWLLLFSAPLFQFLFLRWIWRIFLWFQFLWRMHNLDLQLFPTHPDRAGGLGFIAETQQFFAVLLFAESTALAGVIANSLIYDNGSLRSYAPIIAAYTVIVLCLVLAPLVIFAKLLLQTKLRGLKQYGTLATTYTGSFHKKWIQHLVPDPEPLLGTGDIQSLADLGNSYSIIQSMYLLPIDPQTPILLLVATLLPMTPLVLTVMPLKEVLKLVFKMVA